MINGTELKSTITILLVWMWVWGILTGYLVGNYIIPHLQKKPSKAGCKK